jgi:hypothetical protein
MKKTETELGLCGVRIDTETLTEFKTGELLEYLRTESTYCNKTGNIRIKLH